MTPSSSLSRQAVTAAVLLASALSCVAQADADQLVVPAGLYDITAETLLPNLEHNLRDAKTMTRHCLGTQSATSLFPLLRHVAFAGCTLAQGRVQDDEQVFTLVCSNPQAAGGQARFRVGASALDGVLELKMGGKNMTLSQRIRAQRLDACK